MSYIDKKKGTSAPRITWVVGLKACPIPAVIENERKEKGITRPRKLVSNIASTIGTIIHADIENIMREKVGLPKTRHKYKKSDKFFMKKERLREVNGHVNRIKVKKKKCMEAFNDFWTDYTKEGDITPIHVEKRVGNEKTGMGTVDLICFLTLKGRVYTLTDKVGAVKWFKECKCKKTDTCTCKMHKCITILDWKSGKNYQKASYQPQGAAYIYAALGMGLISSDKYPINEDAWCVLLGGSTKKKNYKLVKGSYHEGIADYLKGLEIFRDPQKFLKEDFGELTLTGKCMFCSYMLECPNRFIAGADECDVVYNDEKEGGTKEVDA